MNLRNHCNPQTKFGTKNFGLVEAIVAHGCVQKPGIESIEAAKVRFVDGTEYECEEIIFTTGYRNTFPFLCEGLREIAAEAIDPRKLYKHCVHPRLGAEVFWCGFARPAFGAVPPMAEMQARWMALLCSGARTLPDIDDMQAVIERDARRECKQFADDAGRIRSLTDYVSYMDDVAGLVGCRPRLWKLWWSDRRVWRRVMLGPLTGAQYRLTGPGSRTEAARQTLMRTPVLWGPGYVYLVISLFFQLLAYTGLPFFKAPPALACQPYRRAVPGPQRQKTTPTPNRAGSDHPPQPDEAARSGLAPAPPL
jgi:dimethylaniline monooxygenase (N-oxide forming)